MSTDRHQWCGSQLQRQAQLAARAEGRAGQGGRVGQKPGLGCRLVAHPMVRPENIAPGRFQIFTPKYAREYAR